MDVETVVRQYDWVSSDFGVLRVGEADRTAAASRLEASLTAILRAEEESDAESAFFRGVENVAFVSGTVFGVSAKVTDCLLAAWPLATAAGRRYGLATLEQIACGADAGSRSAQPDFRVVEYCQARLWEHRELILESLELGGLRWAAVRILAAIGRDDPRVRARFLELLETESDAMVLRALEDSLRHG